MTYQEWERRQQDMGTPISTVVLREMYADWTADREAEHLRMMGKLDVSEHEGMRRKQRAEAAEAERDRWREKAAEYCRDWQRVSKQLADAEAERDEWKANARDVAEDVLDWQNRAKDIAAERDKLAARVKELEKALGKASKAMHYELPRWEHVELLKAVDAALRPEEEPHD